MRKVIGKLVFDTNTAEHMCDVRCTVYSDDFDWHDTALYRTSKGQWFLAGYGNALSMWGRKGLGGPIPGEGIRLVTDDEARAFLEAEDMDDLIEDFFEVAEG